jgi:uncharacterized protein
MAAPAEALDIPARPAARVNDYANVLSGPVRQTLERELAALEDTTSSQIFVAIFPSLEQESLEDFVNRLFERWKVGNKDLDNGVLLAVFMAEKRARIEVGYGLEGVMTDALASRIIRNELAPEFQAGHHDAGIVRTVRALALAVQGEYKAPARDDEEGGGWKSLFPLLILLFFIFVGRGGLWPLLFGSTVFSGSGRRRYRGNDPWGGMGGGFGGFGGGFGGGGGGGFSGGGGGSSGGGGASGGW